MKLYVFPVAPNPTKIRLYLAEKQAGGTRIPLEEVTVDLARGEQSSPEHRARTPFASLPVLELDDGSYLIESLAAIEYLEESYPDPPMIGRTPLERARVRELERIAELRVMGPIARWIHATRSPLGLPPQPEVAAQARQALPSGLAYLDGLLTDGRPFLAGPHPSIADCTLAAALQFGRFGQLELDPAFKGLARWDETYRRRPCVQSVLVV